MQQILKHYLVILLAFSALAASACPITIPTPVYYSCPVMQISPHLYVTDTRCVEPESTFVWIDKCKIALEYKMVLPYRWQHPQYKHFTAVFLADPEYAHRLDLYSTYKWFPYLLRTLANWFGTIA